jgi:hypothetical protein
VVSQLWTVTDSIAELIHHTTGDSLSSKIQLEQTKPHFVNRKYCYSEYYKFVENICEIFLYTDYNAEGLRV